MEAEISKYSDISKPCDLVRSRKSVFQIMGTGFSSLEILQETESRKD